MTEEKNNREPTAFHLRCEVDQFCHQKTHCSNVPVSSDDAYGTFRGNGSCSSEGPSWMRFRTSELIWKISKYLTIMSTVYRVNPRNLANTSAQGVHVLWLLC